VKVEKNSSQKGRYSAPKLIIYGDMAQLTAGGTGSITEAVAMDMASMHKI